MKAGPAAPELIFDWARREPSTFKLLGLLLCSLVAHAATFFLFQVVDRRAVTLPRTAPRVGVLSPANADFGDLLRWLEAEDPALLASATDLVPPGLAISRYRASFAVPRTRPLLPPAESPKSISYPPAREPLDFISGSTLRPSAPVSSRPAQPTVLTFTGTLAARALADADAPSWPRPNAALPPAHWLIGVNERGEVRHTFLQQSSTDPNLDSAAAGSLQKLRFAPVDALMTWSFATFSWGDPASAPTQPAL